MTDQATNVALGMKLLKYSKSNIMYLPEPLVFTSYNNQYLSLDPKAQIQLK